MKALCFAVFLFMDVLVQSVRPTTDQNYCTLLGYKKNAVYACEENEVSGGTVAMGIGEITGTRCVCHLRYTGGTDSSTSTVAVKYRIQKNEMSHRIKLFVVNQKYGKTNLDIATKAMQVTSDGPTKITVERNTTLHLRLGTRCLVIKLPGANGSERLTLSCLKANSQYPIPDAVETKNTQITTQPQTTIRRTSTITTSRTTLTMTTAPQTSPGRISTVKSSPKTPTTTFLGSTAADRSSVSSPRGEQTLDVGVKNSATTNYNVFSIDTKEEEVKPTPAVQTGTITIIIIVAVVAVVCTVSVVMVLYCLKRRKTHAFQRPVEQSTQQNEEDYEITENAMYVAYNSINTRNGDCEQIYEEADIENNQTGKEALSLLHDNEISVKDVDHRDKTLR